VPLNGRSRMRVQLLNDAFIAVPRVGCDREVQGTDRSPSFRNSHFDIRNFTASAHAGMDRGSFSNVECQVQNGFRELNGGASQWT
jgi:hypothetical protein